MILLDIKWKERMGKLLRIWYDSRAYKKEVDQMIMTPTSIEKKHLMWFIGN